MSGSLSPLRPNIVCHRNKDTLILLWNRVGVESGISRQREYVTGL